MDYNLNKTRFNFNLRNSLKSLTEAKNILKNSPELFHYSKKIKDIISEIESIVNDKNKIDINLD
jgi:hypothetical protein